jgi:hypothetical protein
MSRISADVNLHLALIGFCQFAVNYEGFYSVLLTQLIGQITCWRVEDRIPGYPINLGQHTDFDSRESRVETLTRTDVLHFLAPASSKTV